MNYKKAYLEALEKAKESLKDGGISQNSIDYIQSIFPELQESKEEGIRTGLINGFKECLKNSQYPKNAQKYWHNIKIEDILAWLEKQGKEEKPQVYETKDGEIITYSKNERYKVVEPKLKFNVGDWVVFNNKHQSIYQIEKIENGYYILRHTHGGSFRVCVLHDESLRLWSIADIKDGDVLAVNSMPFIYNGSKNEVTVGAYCGFNTKHSFSFAYNYVINQNITPATKEQRELLFSKMHEAGYVWDADKKELSFIIPENLKGTDPDGGVVGERGEEGYV